MKRGKVVSKKKKVNKTFFDDKKLLAVSIMLFLVFAIALAFVNAPKNSSITGQQVEGGKGKIESFFSFDRENFDTQIAKYLIFFMLILLIFSILNFAKFPESEVLQFLIALPVAFLASAYLVPGEVLTILKSYEALGIVLSFILPFIILIFFSAALVSNEKIKKMSMPKIMLEVFLWMFFMVILGYKIIAGIVNKEIPLGLNLPIVIMGTVFLFSFLIFAFNKKFRNWMWKIGLDIRKGKEEARRAELVEQRKTQSALAETGEE